MRKQKFKYKGTSQPASCISSDISTGENLTSIGESRITNRDGASPPGLPPAAARAEISVRVHMLKSIKK